MKGTIGYRAVFLQISRPSVVRRRDLPVVALHLRPTNTTCGLSLGCYSNLIQFSSVKSHFRKPFGYTKLIVNILSIL
jgi:hypothetical protein